MFKAATAFALIALLLPCLVIAASATPSASETPFFSVNYGLQSNLKSNILFLDSANQEAYFVVKPVAPATNLLTRAIYPSADEIFVVNKSGQLVESEREFLGGCVNTYLKNEENGLRIELKLNPICQRCGGNYQASLDVYNPSQPEKLQKVIVPFLLPCKADVLMVTQASKLEKDQDFYEALPAYMKTIGKEGLTARYVELDSRQAQQSLGFKQITENQDKAYSPVLYSGALTFKTRVEYETETQELSNDYLVRLSRKVTYFRHNREEALYLNLEMQLMPENDQGYGEGRFVNFEVYGVDLLSGMGSSLSTTPQQIVGKEIHGEIKLIKKQFAETPIIRVNYTCLSQKETILLYEKSDMDAICYDKKIYFYLKESKGTINVCASLNKKLVCSPLGTPFSIEGMAFESSIEKIAVIPETMEFQITLFNEQGTYTNNLKSSALHELIRDQILQVQAAVQPKYLILLGGTKVMPFFIEDLGIIPGGAGREKLYVEIPSDDYYGAEFGLFSRKLIIARMPTALDDKDTSRISRMLRNAINSRSTPVTLPKIIADSCGAKDYCFIKNDVDALSNFFYGTKCSEKTNCFLAPPWCMQTEANGQCTKEKALLQAISAPSLLYLSSHGTGNAFLVEGKTGKDNLLLTGQAINSLDLYYPAVISDACYGASIDFTAPLKDYPSRELFGIESTALSFLYSGARLFVGNTRNGWGRAKPTQARSAQLLAEFIAFSLSKDLTQETFDKLKIPSPAKQLTAGEAFLEMKKRYFSIIEKGQAKKISSIIDQAAFLTISFYGDPTQKLTIG